MNFIKKNSVLILYSSIIISLAFAWILELVFKMEPCSLCLLQRFGLYIALSFLTIYLIVSKISKYLNLGLLFLSLIGIGFSLLSGLRQTYIQLLPEDKIPSCGADLETLLKIVTPLEAIKKVFQGSGECAEKAVVFLHLSLANWATILFFIFFIYNTYLLIKEYKR